MKKQRDKNVIRPKISAAEADNLYTVQDYMDRLTLIALSRFEWEGLPSSMDQRYLEWCLFMFGQAALLKTPEYGYINTKAVAAGELNIYGLPTEINCYSFNGFSETRKVYTGILKNAKGETVNKDTDEAILVLNNYLRVGNFETLNMFAARLADAQRSVDTNVRNQKFPLMILTDENQLLSMKNVYRQVDGNQPVIYGSNKALSLDDVKVLKTDAPYVADKLMQYKMKIWNEALLYLGIQVVDEKKERLVEAETAQNNEVTNMNLQSALVPRQQAAEQFNEKFGTHVSVKVRSDLGNVIKTQLSTISDWVDEDRDGVVDTEEVKNG